MGTNAVWAVYIQHLFCTFSSFAHHLLKYYSVMHKADNQQLAQLGMNTILLLHSHYATQFSIAKLDRVKKSCT